jgi:choline-sulfatase
LPARAAFFTGRMPSETGVRSESRQLRSDLPTLGAWFRDTAGYATYYAGKWHVPEYMPSGHEAIPGFYTMATGVDGNGFLMDTHVSTACEAFVRNYTDAKPFLLVAGFMNPHDVCEWQFLNTANRDDLWFPELEDVLPPLPDNMQIPEGEPEAIVNFRETLDPHVGSWNELQYRYYLWSYYRHIDMVDGEIARIMDAIEETGRSEDTIVMLTSDHGEGLGHHQMTHKLFPYDEVCRVPFLVSRPGVLPGNRVDDETLVSGLDIFPTLCGLAGIQAPPQMRGVDLSATLTDGVRLERDFVPIEVMKNGNVIRTERYKYVSFEGDEHEMLFDLDADPGETTNLAASPEAAADSTLGPVLEKHRSILANWRETLEKP